LPSTASFYDSKIALVPVNDPRRLHPFIGFKYIKPNWNPTTKKMSPGKYTYNNQAVQGVTKLLKDLYWPKYNHWNALANPISKELLKRHPPLSSTPSSSSSSSAELTGRERQTKAAKKGMSLGRALGRDLAIALELRNKYNLGDKIWERNDIDARKQFATSMTQIDQKKFNTITHRRCNYFRICWTKLNEDGLRPLEVELPVGIVVNGRKKLGTGIDLVCMDKNNWYCRMELKTTKNTLHELLITTGNKMEKPPFTDKDDSPLNQYFVQTTTNDVLYENSYPRHYGISLLMINTPNKAYIFKLSEFIPIYQQQARKEELKKQLILAVS